MKDRKYIYIYIPLETFKVGKYDEIVKGIDKI